MLQPSDRQAFGELISAMYAYHRTPCSPMIIGVYWRGCQRWSMEQITHAIDVLTADAEAGKFVPKIGDMTRVLEGTHTDRSMLAWGKALVAMRSVGAYTDVIFDDSATHAAVDDIGGWPKLCRTPVAELGYVQTAFCKSHKAYVGRGTFEYPRVLLGSDRSADAEWEAKGLPPPKPALVGDPKLCAKVFEGGGATGKTKVSFQSLGALVALALPVRESDQDPSFRRMRRTP